MSFDAPPATTALRWMPALLALAALPGLALVPIVRTGPPWTIALFAATLLGILALVGGVWWRMRRPLRYLVDEGRLTVPAHLRPVHVSLPGARVRRGRATGWKVSGTNLADYLLGAFRDAEGGYHAAATTAEGVWVTGDRRVFVTPADVDAFVRALVEQGAIEVPG